MYGSSLDDLASSRFGVPGLFGYQRQIIEEILTACSPWNEPGEGGTPDIQPRGIIILPTGAGKSLCYMLPALLIDGYTLILYPLNALINDQLRRFKAAGIPAAALRGGMPAAERKTTLDRIARGDFRAVLTNPETLLTPAVAATVGSSPPRHVVLDEAHTVSEWGESFRPAYLEAVELLRELPAARISAFTATATPELLPRISRLIFGTRGSSLTSRSPARGNIACSLIRTASPEATLMRLLAAGSIEPPAIFFCPTRRRAELTALRTGLELGRDEVRFYHAGLPRELKLKREAWFMEGGRRFLAATCAFGLGVDCPGVRTVVHLSPPSSVEAYLQESGRAGRDGGPSRAILLLPSGFTTAGTPPRQAALIRALTEERSCLQAALIRLFEPDSEPSPCGVCDLCRGLRDSGDPALRALLDVVRRTPGLLTKSDAADLLKGYCTPGLASAGIEGSPRFGALAAWDYEWIEELVEGALCGKNLRIRGRGGRLRPGKMRLNR